MLGVFSVNPRAGPTRQFKGFSGRVIFAFMWSVSSPLGLCRVRRTIAVPTDAVGAPAAFGYLVRAVFFCFSVGYSF